VILHSYVKLPEGTIAKLPERCKWPLKDGHGETPAAKTGFYQQKFPGPTSPKWEASDFLAPPIPVLTGTGLSKRMVISSVVMLGRNSNRMGFWGGFHREASQPNRDLTVKSWGRMGCGSHRPPSFRFFVILGERDCRSLCWLVVGFYPSEK